MHTIAIWSGTSWWHVQKVNKSFSGMPNVVDIAWWHSLIAGFDELDRNNDTTLDKVLRICMQEKFKLKDFSDAPAFLYLVK